jgi:hypothetical protein
MNGVPRVSRDEPDEVGTIRAGTSLDTLFNERGLNAASGEQGVESA